MFKTKRLRQTQIVSEEDFETYEHKRLTDFHARCFLPQLALAEARRFDETLALARQLPVYGEDE